MPEQPTNWQPFHPDGDPSAPPTGAWAAPSVGAPQAPGQYPQAPGQYTQAGPYPQPPYSQAQYPPAPQGYYPGAPPYSAPGYSPTGPYYGPVTRPSTLEWASRLMGLGAVLSAISLFAGLSTLPSSGTTEANSYNAGFVIGGLVYIGLWIWMAIANYRGNQWARVTATVFFGIECLAFLGSIGLAFSQNISGGRLLLGTVTWINALVIIILLWNSKTTFYVRNRRH